jgi:hypothetical protein
MNLMVSELIVSTYCIPIAAVASAQKGWKMGSTFCRTSGFILTALVESGFRLDILLDLSLYLQVIQFNFHHFPQYVGEYIYNHNLNVRHELHG